MSSMLSSLAPRVQQYSRYLWMWWYAKQRSGTGLCPADPVIFIFDIMTVSVAASKQRKILPRLAQTQTIIDTTLPHCFGK